MNSLQSNTGFLIETFLTQLNIEIASLPIDQEQDKQSPKDLVFSEEDEPDPHHQIVKRIVKRVCKGIINNTQPDFSKLPQNIKILTESTLFKDPKEAYTALKDSVVKQEIGRKPFYHMLIEGMVLGNLCKEGAEIWIKKEEKRKGGANNKDQFELGKKLFCHLKDRYPDHALEILIYLIDYSDPKQMVVEYFNEICQKIDPKDISKLIGIAKKILMNFLIRQEKVDPLLCSLKNLSEVYGKNDLFDFAFRYGLKLPCPALDNKKKHMFSSHISDYKKKKNLSSLKQAIELLKGTHFADAKMWKEVIELAAHSKEKTTLLNNLLGYFQGVWFKSIQKSPENIVKIWIKLLKSISTSENLIIHLSEHIEELDSLVSWPQIRKQKQIFYETLLERGVERLKANPKLIKDEEFFCCFCRLLTLAVPSLPSEKIGEEYEEIFKNLVLAAKLMKEEAQELVFHLIQKSCQCLSDSEAHQSALNLFIWGIANGMKIDSSYVIKDYLNLLQRLDSEQLGELRLKGLNHIPIQKISCQRWREWILAYFHSTLKLKQENEIRFVFARGLNVINELNEQWKREITKTKDYLDGKEKELILIETIEILIDLVKKFDEKFGDMLIREIYAFILDQKDSGNLLTTLVTQLIKVRNLPNSQKRYLACAAADLFCQCFDKIDKSRELVQELYCQLSEFRDQPEVKDRLFNVFSQNLSPEIYEHLLEHFNMVSAVVNDVLLHVFQKDDSESSQIIHALDFLFKIHLYMKDKLQSSVVVKAFNFLLPLEILNREFFFHFARRFSFLICDPGFYSPKIICKILKKFKNFIGVTNFCDSKLLYNYAFYLKIYLDFPEVRKGEGISYLNHLLKSAGKTKEMSDISVKKLNKLLKVAHKKNFYDHCPSLFWMHRSYFLSFVDQKIVNVFIPPNSSRESRLEGIRLIIDKLILSGKSGNLFRAAGILVSEIQAGSEANVPEAARFKFEVSELKELYSEILDTYVERQSTTHIISTHYNLTLPELIFRTMLRPYEIEENNYAVEIVPLMVSALIKVYEIHKEQGKPYAKYFLEQAKDYLLRALHEDYYDIEKILENEGFRKVYVKVVEKLIKHREVQEVPLQQLAGGAENVIRLFDEK